MGEMVYKFKMKYYTIFFSNGFLINVKICLLE